MRGWPWQRLAPVEEDDGGGLPGPVHGHLRPQAGSRARCPDAGWLGLMAGGRERSVRPHRLRGRCHEPGPCLAASGLQRQRHARGLSGAADHHAADLWRTTLVVHLSAAAPGQRSTATGHQALSAPGERYFGSRAGYGLTYTSCQESGQFRSMFRQLAAEMGTDEKAVRAALSGGWRP